MSSSTIDPDWQRIHYADSTIVDLHAHPGLKISLFDKAFTAPFHASGAFNPFSFESGFSNLHLGGVDVLLSAIYAPERQIVTQEAPAASMWASAPISTASSTRPTTCPTLRIWSA